MFLLPQQYKFSHHYRFETVSVKKSNILSIENRTINRLFPFKLVMIFLMIIFCTGLLFPVLTPEFNGKSIINHVLSNMFSLVCHQSDQALFNFNNNHTLVCARCLGIYFGALVLIIVITIQSIRLNLGLKPLIIFSAPMLLDAIFVRLNFYSYSKTVAFITGLLFGMIAVFYIIDTIEKSFDTQQNEKYEF